MQIRNLRTSLLAVLGGFACTAAVADNLPDAGSICAEARANPLRAKLKYIQQPMQDSAVISRIFAARVNDYSAELRTAEEVDKKYPDVWMEAFYLLDKGEQTRAEKRLAYSVGDKINVQGKVNGIEFVPWPEEAPNQRPACKILLSIDWDKTGNQ